MLLMGYVHEGFRGRLLCKSMRISKAGPFWTSDSADSNTWVVTEYNFCAPRLSTTTALRRTVGQSLTPVQSLFDIFSRQHSYNSG